MSYNKNIWFLLVVFVSFTAHGQTTLKGRVVDSDTKRPVPYVNIWVEGSKQGGASDYDGAFEFTIKYLADSTWLRIQAIGYHEQRMKAYMFIGQGTEVPLKPKVIEIKEFTKVSRNLIKDPYEIVKQGVTHLEDRKKKGYKLYGTFHNIFQDYKEFEVKNHSVSNVVVDVKPRRTYSGADEITVIKIKNADSFWSKFRYNEDAVLPQYKIPDYGTNHLQFLLNMNPLRYPNRPTFDFVKKLNTDFILDHWFVLDSVRSYNGRLTYFVNVFIKPHIQYGYINIVPNYYLTGRKFSNHTYNKASGKSAQLSVGKFWVDVDDLAIVYFEYYNGFLNDRYKFCAEYSKKSNGEYYPSKLYFANKFWMKDQPNFVRPSLYLEDALECERGSYYYRKLIDQHSKSAEDRFIVNSIVDQNTIYAAASKHRHSSYAYALAFTKAAEEIQENLELKEYNKYFHHRLFRIDSVKVNRNQCYKQSSYTDFDRNIFYLGDPAQHEFLYNSGAVKANWVNTDSLERWTMGIILDHKARREDVKVPTLIPVTSKDEYLYHRLPNDSTKMFDKEYLIKGYVKFFEMIKTD